MRRQALSWPYMTGLVVLVGLPLLGAIVLSFLEFSGIGPAEYVGFENFERLLQDESFWRSAGNSLIFVAISVPLRLAGAVAFALLLHKRSRVAASGRVAAYLPTVIPDVAYALLWLWLLNPLYGPLALALGAAGVGDVLTDPWGARVAIAVMSAFQIGEAFIVALAARRLIPGQLYEAAAVEGARPWFIFRKVTLPLMAPILGLLALRDVILSFQVNFVPALLVTEGGPRLATTYLPLYAYQQGFRYFKLGYAAAMTLTMFLLTALVVFMQFRLFRRWRAR